MNSKYLCHCLTAGMVSVLIWLHLPGKTQSSPAQSLLAAQSKILTATRGIHEATRPAAVTNDVVEDAINAIFPTMAQNMTDFLKSLIADIDDAQKHLLTNERQLLSTAERQRLSTEPLSSLLKTPGDLQTLLETKHDENVLVRLGSYKYSESTYNLFYEEYPMPTHRLPAGRLFADLVLEVAPTAEAAKQKTAALKTEDAKQNDALQLILTPLLLDKHLVHRLQSIPGFKESSLTHAWLTAVANDSNTSGRPTRFIQIVSNLLVLNDALIYMKNLGVKNRATAQQDIAKQLQTVSVSLQRVATYLWTLRDDMLSSAGITASVAELRFSSDPDRFDIAWQEIFGGIHGYGGRLLLDTSEAGIRVAEAARSSQETARSLNRMFPKKDRSQGAPTESKSAQSEQAAPIPESQYPLLANNLYEAIRDKDRLVDATIDAYLSPRTAFSVSGQHIEEYGTLFDLGYDTSKLVAFLPQTVSAYRDYPGMTFNLSLHGSFYDPNSGLHTAVAPNIGVGIAWQNVVPFHQAANPNFEPPLLLSFSVQSDGRLLRLPPVRHWSLQAGLVFHYYMKSDPNPGGAAGLYVRYRDRKNFWEVSAQTGIDQDQHGYLGAGIAKSW